MARQFVERALCIGALNTLIFAVAKNQSEKESREIVFFRDGRQMWTLVLVIDPIMTLAGHRAVRDTVAFRTAFQIRGALKAVRAMLGRRGRGEHVNVRR